MIGSDVPRPDTGGTTPCGGERPRFQPFETTSLLNRLRRDRFPFGWTANPFRGCEIGCRYCYARPTHEYMGHADPGEFEERIYVKAPARPRQLSLGW